MVGSPENFVGGNSGENVSDEERRRLEEALGRKATGVIEGEAETRLTEGEIRDKIARVMKASVNKDRYGNTISDESLERLQNEVIRLLDGKSPDEVLRFYDEKIQALMKEGEQERVEWNATVNSKTKEEKEVMYARILLTEDDLRQAMREAEMVGVLKMDEENMTPVSMKLVGYFDKQPGDDNVEEEVVEPEDEREEGEPEPGVEPKSKAHEDEKEKPAKLTVGSLDVNAPDYRERFLQRRKEIGDIVRASNSLSDEVKNLLLSDLHEVEQLEQWQAEQAMQSGFASTPKGEAASDDEVAKAAEVAGASRWGWFRKSKAEKRQVVEETPEEKQRKREYREALSNWAKEVTPGRLDPEVAKIYAEKQAEKARIDAEKQAEKEYYDRLHKWAEEESRNPNKNRFGDPELPPENRERLLSKLGNGLKGRKSLKKVARKATLVLALTLALTSSGVVAATAFNGNNTAYAAELEGADSAENDQQVVKILEQSGLTGDSANSVAESLGMSAEDLMGGEIDYLKHDLLAEGAALYEGIADRESSFVTSSGMIMYMAKYDDEARHGNSFAASIADLKDDREALVNALMQNNIELPYQLASTTAAMPELLRACGVDEAVVTNENVAERAQAVMDAMLADGGGDLQKKLAAALNIALHNENTNVNVYREYGLERTFYVKPFDAEKVDKPGDIQVATDVKQRDGNWQVQIDVAYASGNHEVIDLNLGCGGQVNMYADSYVVRVPFTDENNIEHENVGIATIVTTEREDGTTTTETVYTDLGTDPDKVQNNEETEGEKPGEETIIQKNAQNLIAGMQHGLQAEGVNNTVNQTANVVPEIVDNGDGTSSYESNDGTTATVADGQVTAVTDGTGTVNVTSGDMNPVGTVTSSPLEGGGEEGGGEEGGGEEGGGQGYSESAYENAL